MWIRDVDLPGELITAYEADKLVFFVGAGVSLDPPSSLPLFTGLTSAIAQEVGLELTDDVWSRPDRVLGDIDRDRLTDVHARIADLIDPAGSLPNRNHAAIAALASRRTLRVVSTNYDRHISTALEQLLGTTITEFAAPALPLGDDFEGVVYVHGRLDRPPRTLVATDRDFGQAYLTSGWAARFLERMFSSFTVLFIGYSHDDVVMSYLARGLGPTSKRFVLTDRADDPQWKRLAIEPVGYKSDGTSHESLTGALEGWAEQVRMGLLEHSERVRVLVSKPPSGVPEEDSYLEMIVADETTVDFFTTHATSVAWLQWLVERPEGQRLFDPTGLNSKVQNSLASWFAQHFVAVPEHSQTALDVLHRHGGELSRPLTLEIARHLHLVGSPRSPHLDRWIYLLLQTPPRDHERDLLDYLLAGVELPTERSAGLALLDALLEPRLALDSSFSTSGPRPTIVMRGNDHWLREAWTERFVPHLTDLVDELLPILDRHLRRAHRLVVGTDERRWDPVSFSRSAIEPHAQDRHGDEANRLIDAARDSLVHAIEVGSPIGTAFRETWASSDVPLLQRLAIHAWTVVDDASPADRLQRILRCDWVYKTDLHHEVLQLIHKLAPSIADDELQSLVDRVVEGPGDFDWADRAVYDLLGWIHDAAPLHNGAASALRLVQDRYPDWRQRDHADFHTWMESGSWTPESPLSPEEIASATREDPEAAARTLIDVAASHKGRQFRYGDEGLARSIRTAVAEDAVVGLELIGALSAIDDPGRAAVASAVIDGWSTAAIVDAPTTGAILEALEAAVFLTDVGDQAIRLVETAASSSNSLDLGTTGGRSLARRLWSLGSSSGPAVESVGGFAWAMNYWPGQLAEFWLHTISAEWKQAGDSWRGIDSLVRSHLEEMISAPGSSGLAVRTILASRTHFLFAADPEWASRHVVPLLSFSEETEHPEVIWDGFLTAGRWNDRLLAVGLRDYYQAAARRADLLNDDAQGRLMGHIAGVAIEASTAPLEDDWLFRIVSSLSQPLRARWANEVAWLLADVPHEVAESAWTRWIKAYWERRLSSYPAPLEMAEATAMATWPLSLGTHSREAIHLLLKRPAQLDQHSNLLRTLTRKTEGVLDPQFGDLVHHLLQHTSPPFWHCEELEQIVKRLEPTEPDTSRRGIAAEALRLECRLAPTWISG